MAGRRILGIDIETFSDVDLGKCGVYKYVEGDFHILLFAYAFDDEDVQVVDMACGETLPKRVVDAIFDENVIKAAWNALKPLADGSVAAEKNGLTQAMVQELVKNVWVSKDGIEVELKADGVIRIAEDELVG